MSRDNPLLGTREASAGGASRMLGGQTRSRLAPGGGRSLPLSAAETNAQPQGSLPAFRAPDHTQIDDYRGDPNAYAYRNSWPCQGAAHDLGSQATTHCQAPTSPSLLDSDRKLAPVHNAFCPRRRVPRSQIGIDRHEKAGLHHERHAGARMSGQSDLVIAFRVKRGLGEVTSHEAEPEPSVRLVEKAEIQPKLVFGTTLARGSSIY